MWFAKISLLQHDLKKFWNNTFASRVCWMIYDLDKSVQFTVEWTHHLSNSDTEIDIAKMTSWYIHWFITQSVLIAMFRCLAFLILSMNLFINIKHNLSISKDLDEVWLWKTCDYFSQMRRSRYITKIPGIFYTALRFHSWWAVDLKVRVARPTWRHFNRSQAWQMPISFNSEPHSQYSHLISAEKVHNYT